MKLTITLAQVILGLAIWGSAALAAGPSPGSGQWVACPNNNPVCASQLGPDLDPTNEIFDCDANNGRPGAALQHAGTGRAHCWSS